MMPKTTLSPKPAFGKAAKPETLEAAKPQAAVDAEEEKIFERDLEQLMTIISAFSACAPEATAQTDERIRNMMLSLVASNAYAKDKSKLEAQQVANRKKPAAEMRIKTRKSHSSGHKKLTHEFKARRPAGATKLLQTQTGAVPVTYLAGVAYGLDGRPVQPAGYRCPPPSPPVLLL